MAKFDANTLRELRALQEIAIRTEKHSDTAVVIWVVVADDEVFPASGARQQGTLVPGPRGGWARHIGVCRPPVGGAGIPGERRRCDCAGQ